MCAGILPAVGNKLSLLSAVGLCSEGRTHNRLQTRDFCATNTMNETKKVGGVKVMAGLGLDQPSLSRDV